MKLGCKVAYFVCMVQSGAGQYCYEIFYSEVGYLVCTRMGGWITSDRQYVLVPDMV